MIQAKQGDTYRLFHVFRKDSKTMINKLKTNLKKKWKYDPRGNPWYTCIAQGNLRLLPSIFKKAAKQLRIVTEYRNGSDLWLGDKNSKS